MGPPKLLPDTTRVRCGYGARSIQLDAKGTTLFVGCKDGSITAVDLLKVVEGKRHPERRLRSGLGSKWKAGVRSMYDLGEGWLLIGNDLGELSLLRWDVPERNVEERPLPRNPAIENGSWAPVTEIELWDDSHLQVSYRNHDACLLRLEAVRRAFNGEPVFRETGFEEHLLSKRLEGLKSVSRVVKISPRRWVVVAESGEIWRCGEDCGLPERLDKVWEEFERPGFVSDVAVVRAGHQGEGKGIYIATDAGVYLLGWSVEGQFRTAERVQLTGITGMCMSVSYAEREGHSFLWVSDLTGDVHLFWNRETGSQEGRPHWRRSGLRLERLQVIRSTAVSLRHKGREFLMIGQACRSDQIAVTWYSIGEARQQVSSRSSTQPSVADLLSWGTWKDLDNTWNPRAFSTNPVERERLEKSRKQWCPEARFAEFLEETGEHLEQLTHFLANPGTSLACSVLDAIYDEKHPDRVSQALTLWTHALVGVINRRLGDRREQQCLGVIRWLRRLGEDLASRSWSANISETIERCIQHNRKWGVFGGVYDQRRGISAPLEALAPHTAEDRKLDHLVYSTLIFGRRVDVEADLTSEPRQELTPWDVRYLRTENGRELIAVSWKRGGIEIYESKRGTWDRRQLVPGRADESGGELSNEGYSRKIILGIFRGNAYVLEAPTKFQDDDSFHLHWIDEGAPTLQGPPAILQDKESVYSLLELSEGIILAGLLGVGGKARVAVVRITDAGGIEFLEAQGKITHLPTAYPEFRSIKRNPVWALAADESKEKLSDDPYTVFAGCGDGLVWKIKIQIGVDGFTIPEDPIRVGRLGAPVWALAYRTREGGRTARVVAGGADGTVVAFEEIKGRLVGKEAYATLWATREEGPISRVHAFDGELEGEEGMVLFITQQGMAVLVSDRLKVEDLEDWEKHHRLKIPGERLGRFNLGTTVFGSALLKMKRGPGNAQGGESSAPPPGQAARLVIATGDGRLRLLALHYPKYTEARRKMFKRIWDLWTDTLKGEDGQLQGYLLRRTESMHAAAPYLPAVMVRWILWPEPKASLPNWQDRNPDIYTKWNSGPSRQWLPRHLQPLIDLDEAWAAKEGTLRGKLKAALLAAREVQDMRLFKEIVEVALNRANHQLYEQARAATSPGEDRLPDFSGKFKDLLQDLDDVNAAWLGWPENLDIKMRIVMAKNLVDGDTLWSLSEALNMASSGPPKEIMSARIDQLHRFLAAGDSLLALETLRAANLALVRSCCRLKPDESLNWDSIRGYYEAVGDFAARSAHSTKGDLGETVTHEICRAYALGMLLCPPSTLRLTCWFCEADLPEELAEQIHLQLELLENLLPARKMPIMPREIFEASMGRMQGLDTDRKFMLQPQQLAYSQKHEKEVGADNLKLIEQWKPFEELLIWLYDLASKLSNEAGSVDMQPVWDHHDKIKKEQPEISEDDQYPHSRHFWSEALGTLWTDLLRWRLVVEPEAPESGEHSELRSSNPVRPIPVRPDLVLFSRILASWCNNQRKSLQELVKLYKLFEPQRTLYDKVLAAVGDAAEGFRMGASLQKNMVLGVLGHSLLELLDEHLLELWEIAQALDPDRTWRREDKLPPRGHDTRASQFTDYLLESAHNAELIPKNLRNLQGLLSDPEDSRVDTPQEMLEKLGIRERWKLTADTSQEPIREDSSKVREYHFLRLVLNELVRNHHDHGLHDEERPPEIYFQSKGRIRLDFPYKDQEDTRTALSRVLSGNLQQPVSPLSGGRSKSHGAGLYLANLAASAVGWKLKIRDLNIRPGYITFHLFNADAEGAEGMEE